MSSPTRARLASAGSDRECGRNCSSEQAILVDLDPALSGKAPRRLPRNQVGTTEAFQPTVGRYALRLVPFYLP